MADRRTWVAHGIALAAHGAAALALAFTARSATPRAATLPADDASEIAIDLRIEAPFLLEVERGTAVGGQRSADSGRRTADSGRRTADSGQRTADGGHRTAHPSSRRSQPPTLPARSARARRIRAMRSPPRQVVPSPSPRSASRAPARTGS